MTRDRTKQLLPVLTAWAEGLDVQFRLKTNPNWFDNDCGDPSFETDADWRVKPKPREFWVVLDRESGNPIGCVTTNPGLAPNIVHVTETP